MSLLQAGVDVAALKTQQDAKYFNIAIFSWVVYEMAITEGDSITLFWKHKRWSVSKILFFINRVTATLAVTTFSCLIFVTFPSEYACMVANWAQFTSTIFTIGIVAFTLASRVYALWKGNWIVLTIFFLVMVANWINFLAIYGIALAGGIPIVAQLPFTGCYVLLHSDIMWVSFANTLTFEAISIFLIVYKAWPMARQRDMPTPLFSLLLEDGIAYYLAFTISKLFTVGVIYVPTVISMVVIPSYPANSVAALAVNRLFIRLQRALTNQQPITEFTNADISAIARDTKSGSGGSGPREIVTIGGSDPISRIRARRFHQDELWSTGDIELRSGHDLHMASTRRDSSLNQTTTGDSIAITIDSKVRHVV